MNVHKHHVGAVFAAVFVVVRDSLWWYIITEIIAINDLTVILRKIFQISRYTGIERYWSFVYICLLSYVTLSVHYILQSRGCSYTFKVKSSQVYYNKAFIQPQIPFCFHPSRCIVTRKNNLDIFWNDYRTVKISYQSKRTCCNIHSNREITGEPMARKSNSDDQLCPKARRLVATSREIKALGMRRYRVPANPRPACHWPSWNPDTNRDSWIWSDKHQKTQEEREHAKREFT